MLEHPTNWHPSLRIARISLCQTRESLPVDTVDQKNHVNLANSTSPCSAGGSAVASGRNLKMVFLKGWTGEKL